MTIRNKFELRDVRDDDHIWLVELHNDSKVLYNLTDPTPITLESHMKWWNNSIDGYKNIRKIFTVDQDPVGFCKFYNVDRKNKNCVLGADIHESQRGNGYSYPMWELMLKYCFENLDMFRVSLTTAEYNDIGRRVYTKLGFKEEGKMFSSLKRDDKFYDQICMYKLKGDK